MLSYFIKWVIGSAAILLFMMILASIWLWIFGSDAKSLMGSSLIFQWLLTVSLIHFLSWLVLTFVLFPLWHIIQYGN